ncbi:isopeptide-forming domain-containing fimbrial protein [Alkalihalobacillus clausii]|uniref:isopeptide-forming domain-containing fimbrial protein n=4 Tax=Bacillaceae TaxID=186817 RepID=UPI00204135DD|nr:isopeptide-forming domain-containing fimbrial protein [Shouchella clausii]MCM3548306.1 isopeptide-forming domain-containing fimbrial protein [Shouchella clausii]
MQSKKLLTRRRLLELRKLVIVTMVFLLSLSNFLPYSAQYAQANETPSLSDLELKQDVDGEERKEVEKGATFTFNVDALIPESGSNEGTLTILNQVNKQLAIENVEVVVNEEESDLEATVEEQDVSLELTPEQLDTVAGQHVTLKITAAFQDEVEAGTEIEHVAEAFINGELAEKAEPVTVALLADTEATSEEEEAPAEEEAQQEEEASTEEENANEESSEENKISKEVEISEEERKTDEEAEGEESIVSAADAETNNVVDINHVDSYGISNTANGNYPQIRQFDGNNFNADPKAIVYITGLPNGVSMSNGLAIHPTEDAFYAFGRSSGSGNQFGLYRITADGAAQFVGNLNGVASNAAISQDGERYYHTYVSNGQLFLGTYNLVTGEKEAIPISGYPSNDVGGDLIFDGNGYIWFSNNTAGSIIQMDPKTGEILRRVPITSADGRSLQGGVRGLSFLPNGQILLSSGPGGEGSQRADYFTLDPETLQTTFLGSATVSGEGRFYPSYDLASRVYPVFDPLPPELEAEKSVQVLEKGEGNTDEEHAEVGDTLRYTIQARNTVSDSLVQSMVISDTIPEGLEYVLGTLKVDGEAVTDDEDDDEGHYVDGGVVGSFGNVTDTDWHTVEFDVIVLPGQAGKDIENTALADGNNIDDPKEPSELVEVYPREGPVVEAEKTVSPEGEVFAGNILTYDVTIKNVGEHIAADAVFEDAIPEGTEYVPGSLKIVAGPNTGDLTDEEDDDAGHFAGDKVMIELGNLETTTELPDGVTVQFQVKTLESHVGETVVNQADIQYRNLQTDEEQSAQSNEVTNEIVETPDIDACAQPVALTNGSFEQGPTEGSYRAPYFFLEDEVPGWQTTDDSQGVKIIEIWNYERQYPQGVINFPAPPDGVRYAELNAFDHGLLYQDVETTPGQTIKWRLSHMGRHGVDTMQLRIGQATDDPYDTEIIEQMSDGNTAWGTYTGTYTVPAGQPVTRFGFEAVSTASGSLGAGNFLDDIFLGTEPCVEAEKTVSPEGEVSVGDELTYEVTVKNTGGDIAANAVFEDAIPEGTEYVPGSIKILTGPNAGDLTDADGDDAGHFDGDKVFIQLGDLPNTTDLPGGITVQFKVKTLASHANDVVVNQANVKYKDLLADEEKTTDTNEVETPVVYQKPVIESEKNATLLEKADGNTDADNPEVGDTLLYTIQARNTLEGSIVENFVIFDVIPEGLEYVPGTLKVNGEAVTDEEDDDEGHYVGGEAFGSFGDVTNTEWQTLEFQVIVGEGQAGKDIENVAVVDGDNLDDPDEPREEVKIYPREPKLESRKSAQNADENKERYEVGDTVVYTIESRNTVSDSLLENLMITDVIPEGLTFVEGSLEVSHSGTGSFEDGTVTADFGEVTDIEWRTVTFEATIDPGYSGETIKNVAVVEVPNIDEPDEPETEIDVDPKDPVLESEKNASLIEKAEGNTDEDNPEVGDTLRYTIQTRNTIADSLIENLVIYDVIPEGLEYVPGTLKVNGEAVTDEEDDDQGHYVDGKVEGHFGNVEDTEWHTLEFDVVVLPGQAGSDIQNTAEVDGDNLDEPDRPEEEVKIYPREPKLESKKSATNADESKERFEVGDTVVYTIEARNTVSDSLLEDLTITDQLPEGLTFVEGSLEVSHGGTGNFENGVVTAEFGEVTDTDWRTVTFEATIDSGYSAETIKNVAVVEVPNIDEPDEPETEIDVDPKDPEPESEKSASLLEKADGNTDADNPEVGDKLVYTIQTRNTIEDSLIKNLTISDVIPEGLEYVPGTLKVDGEAVTDENDDDQGHVVDGEVFASFGDVTDTEWHTVEFQVIVGEGQAGKDIENVAVVDGDNFDEPDEPREEVKIYPREPKLESKKSAQNADESKDGYEVGDTVVYTIEARNAVSDSLLENLTITDVLPEGLTFVEASLEVSHGGTGNYEDGTVTAEFGEVTDTDWRTVTFEATIDSGYVGETIKNVALVEVPNIDEPDEPGTDIDVDPKEPKTESKKSAQNADESKDGYEVGDTVVYTIEARNTVEDSLLENLKISDQLPEGLTFVEGSLEVSHGGTGSFEDGTVTAEFGEVKDTDWRTVTFEATIDSGYVGETIKNVALVEVPNIDEPDEPGTDIDVDPKEPKTESKKSATNADESKDGYEVGDTVVYTIETRNTVEDSLLENLKISDQLPEGLTFVEGSLEVSHGGTGNFENGTVSAEFGEVKDTDWRTVTFEATIDSGYSGETIKNVAVVEVPNIDEPDEPGTDVDVDPKKPKTESEKSAALLEKADGNTDEDNPEVGDTLRYTIQTRNTIEDSLIENLTISDVIPEGLEYVPGTLKVDGQAVTDDEDDDQGHYADGKVVGHFGNVEDTEWHTLEFDVVVLPGQAGKDIENVAVVDGDNFDEPDEPREEVEIYPREPQVESRKSATNADESKDGYEVGDTVVYTIEARNTVSDSLFENLKISDQLPEGLTFVEGSLEVSHGGTGSFEDGTVTAEFGEVKDTDWRTVTFEATIDSGYSGEKIKNVAVVEVPHIDEPDEPETEIDVDPKKPKTESEKSSTLLEKADGNTDADNPEVGDTLVYTIQTRNTVEDSLLANLTIRDAIPAGLEYVPGTLKVNGEAVTDENDDDQGHVVDGEVFASFGDVTDTEWRTVEFQVIVGEGQAGKDIENVAVVDGDNFDEPDEPREEVEIYPRDSKLESRKSAKNADENKERYEVGDTVVYTIEARNTIEDSLLENLKISDVLPEGLTFVEGSLEVSHGGTGSYEDGKVTAEFGEVKDTDWRTVTFEATIDPGYAGEKIENVALVEVPNIDDPPEEPSTDIDVDPKEPKLESKKSAKNADESKDGYEVGDTVVYTIETSNTIEDSLVEDLRITDQLPEGLAFVEGSLKVSEGGEGSFEDGTVTATFGNVTDTEWRTVTFEATIEPGFANKTVKNVATVGGGNIDDPDKPEHEVDVDPKQPKLESKKSAKNADESKDGYEVGDKVVYTIEARNTVEDSAVEDLTIIDQLPEGLAFVEGSLQVSDGGTATFEDGTVTADFGTVTDTEWRTVTFEATIESGTSIKNVATVNGGNIDDPDKPEAEIDINEPPAPPTPGDGDKEDPVDPTPGDKPEEPKPGNGGTNKPQEPTPGDKSPSDGSKLPKTATSTYNLLLIGASLLVLGAILWFFRRKKAA